jgi:hypothetical protein
MSMARVYRLPLEAAWEIENGKWKIENEKDRERRPVNFSIFHFQFSIPRQRFGGSRL